MKFNENSKATREGLQTLANFALISCNDIGTLRFQQTLEHDGQDEWEPA